MKRKEHRYEAPFDWELGSAAFEKLKNLLQNPFRRQKQGEKDAEKESRRRREIEVEYQRIWALICDVSCSVRESVVIGLFSCLR